MAILKVSRMGHPVLRQQARPITPDELGTPPLQRLVDDMLDTMEEYQGIGLAAPQVHQGLRLIVLGGDDFDPDDEDGVPLTILANPEWTYRSEESVDGWEGCLSIPEIRGIVPRSQSVELKGLDRQGNTISLRAEGLFARVLQHEIDHLDGILFLDRMANFASLSFLDEQQKYWQ